MWNFTVCFWWMSYDYVTNQYKRKLGEEYIENLGIGFATSREYKYLNIKISKTSNWKCWAVEDYATRQAKFTQIDVSVITFKLILFHYVIKILSSTIIISGYLDFI